jgi:chromosome segregation protein
VAAHEAEANRRRETVRSAERALGVAEAALTRTRSLVEEAREQHGSLEVRVAERRAQLEALVTNVLERYSVAVDTSAVPEGFDAEASGRRIAELKERIARLGDVNVTAIADVRELEERYEFLAGQRRDLEASMEDLRRTIAELSRTTRARFRETFEQANERFQALFLELFRGGRASLKLTEPHNLLDSGVELEVQPPGKKVGNLAMLSGGEKALTAVSLIMALFTLRATPFCLLDEVDAPLDDANVGRFNAMIRRMSELTQFIVITHNKRTMEGSDVLYGVTMGEAGVSQIVSVRMPVREEKQLLVASA